MAAKIMTPSKTLSSILASVCMALATAVPGAATADQKTERAGVEQWRSERVAELTSDTGWLTLVGLFWLSEGPNTFGRAPSNTLVLEHQDLAPTAGTFVLTARHVTFTADPDSGITHAGQRVTTIEMISDAKESPTVVSSGPLRFFIIERTGKLGVRVRDVGSPWRRNFRGLEYFPIDPDWALEARFEPYEPRRHIPITNVLGLEEDKISPGAVVFTRKGRQFRLDAVLESPDAKDLFVMFADQTSGHGTYGAGRFVDVPFATDGKTVIDFNKAYNPPCAFNTFATCPLPPYQNRLALEVTAGEKTYVGPHGGVPEAH
jgi:uncharacterized protein (DUF1684 family)